MNLNSQTVGSKPHDTGRFHPRNLPQLLLALIQRHEKDVSPDVTAHYFHHLRAADVLSAIAFEWNRAMTSKLMALESARSVRRSGRGKPPQFRREKRLRFRGQPK